MTKEQRVDEIDDYCLYLEQLTDLIKNKHIKNVRLKLLDFLKVLQQLADGC